MEAQDLRKTLEELDKKFSSSDWYKSLDDRKVAELKFHNRDRDKKLVASLPQDSYEMLHGNKKFYTTVETSVKYVEEWIKSNVRGKVFLDYACGNGANAIKAAQLGAALSIGLDISDVSVRNAREQAKELGLDANTFFIQGDCENTGLPNESVEVIICSGMLHHLDLSFAFPELRRILKPGGVILCVEALDYNPVIKLYRILTPSMRTDWEKKHILSLKDITFAKKFFDIGEVKYWHMFSIGAAYIKNEALKKGFLSIFNGVDEFLTRVPGLQLLAWQFTFELKKPR